MVTIGRIYIAGSLVISVWSAIYIGPLLVNTPGTLSGIVSVFSILAGVLVAVISIIGDPSMLLTGNWRVAHEHAKDVQIRIANYAHLVLVYVIVLILVLLCTIAQVHKFSGYYWFFVGLAGFATFALLMSLPLPYSLMSIQKERMDEEIKRRKANVSQQ